MSRPRLHASRHHPRPPRPRLHRADRAAARRRRPGAAHDDADVRHHRHDARGRAGGGTPERRRCPATSRRRSRRRAATCETRDTTALAAFRRFGWDAHRVQREMNARLEPRLDSGNERKGRGGRPHRRRSTRASRSSRCATRSRIACSTSAAPPRRSPRRRARAPRSATCSPTSRSSASSRRRRSPPCRARLRDDADRRSLALVLLIGVRGSHRLDRRRVTVRSISAPLDLLVRHARSLERRRSHRAHRASGCPRSSRSSPTAMNQTGDSLSRVVSVAAQTSEDVASSAHELASVSEQISLSAGQMAIAMTEVSLGAEQQVSQLRTRGRHAAGHPRAGDGVKQRSAEVTAFAGDIESTAAQKRTEIERALGILRRREAQRRDAPRARSRRSTRPWTTSTSFVQTVELDRRSDEPARPQRRDRSGARRRCRPRLRRRRRRGAQARRAVADAPRTTSCSSPASSRARVDAQRARDGDERRARRRDRACLARHRRGAVLDHRCGGEDARRRERRVATPPRRTSQAAASAASRRAVDRAHRRRPRVGRAAGQRLHPGAERRVRADDQRLASAPRGLDPAPSARRRTPHALTQRPSPPTGGRLPVGSGFGLSTTGR